VDRLADTLDDGSLPRALLVEVARRSIEAWRTDGRSDPEAIADGEIAGLRRIRPGRVVNATGVLLHTNLGRAQLPTEAADAAATSATDYTALEFDTGSGRRGGRGAYARTLLRVLTGAEDALVVNNNAGGLFLAISAVAEGRGVVVSRGELIEIGGSFRLPDLMAATGARMLEVGTTNRTRLEDYRRACGDDAAMLLKVHPSNYRIEGFAESVDYRPLADLAHQHGLPLVADIGSGLLDSRVPWLPGSPPAWLAEEPAARQTLEAGADLVLFSGDKVLGGPQAGITVGRADLVRKMSRHPVARALRMDGPGLAALAATLEMYAAGRGAEIPFWRAASLTGDHLSERCTEIVEKVSLPGVTVEAGRSLPGAGSVPGRGIPGPVVVVTDPPSDAWETLLAAEPPVIARRDRRGLTIDLRAVDPADDDHVASSLTSACRS
jgi:L-seryl-tRNA(Ser) seleniumtransferase